MARFTSGDKAAATVMTVGLVEAGVAEALRINHQGTVRTLTKHLCSLELRALGVPWNQAQAISRKAAARVFDADSTVETTRNVD
ncbi:MAG: hypothetical protein JO166_07480 [Deltaproteobacteria bacterium]|nr:hypothetical protein [Deltaproteobacteria bacterium]